MRGAADNLATGVAIGGVCAFLWAAGSLAVSAIQWAFAPPACPVINAEPGELVQPHINVVSIDNCPPCEALEATLEPTLAEYRCPFSVGWIKHGDGGQIGWEYPTVIGVVRFEEVSRFTGMRPEPELRAFLDDLVDRAQPR